MFRVSLIRLNGAIAALRIDALIEHIAAKNQILERRPVQELIGLSPFFVAFSVLLYTSQFIRSAVVLRAALKQVFAFYQQLAMSISERT